MIPKWVEELKIGNNCGKAYEALIIAVEALEWYSFIYDGNPKVTVDASIAQSALAQIEKLASR